MIQLPFSRKIRLCSAGNVMSRICFDKFEDFIRIRIKPAGRELKGRNCRDVPQGDIPLGKCWRDVP
jgi:hypothetical protein